MKMFKKLSRAVTLTLFLCAMWAAQSFAAIDFWNISYVGVNAGSLSGTYTATEYNGPWDFGEYSLTQDTYTLGVQGGHNWTVGSAGLVGLEADFNYSGFDDSRTFNAGSSISSVQWNWHGTLRARGGIAVDNALFYVTGGLACVDVDYKFTGDLGSGPVSVNESGTEVGYTYGAGIELLTGKNVSVRGEFLHIGLPSTEVADFGGDTGDFVSSSDSIRLGVNFLF